MNDRSSTKGLSVLVVDDHRISREYTVAALRPLAARITQAGSAHEALQCALRDGPELIFVDLDLAGESGLDLVGRLRRTWPAGRSWPRIFLLSAERPAPDRPAATGTGVEGFLLKPVELNALRALLSPSPASGHAPAAETEADPGLQRLFRQELRARLRDIDDCVCGGDRDAAAAILHQLIASCGLCGERGLERRMRAMLAACREPGSDAGLARSYYAVWTAARSHLAFAGRARTA